MSGISSLSRLIKDPVATQGALPIGTDIQGAIRVVTADLSVWVYDGTATWTRAGGGGGAVNVDNTTIQLDTNNNISIKPKGITDGLIADASSIIRAWNNTITYAVGQMVISANGIWMCRTAGVNLQPSLATNNWRQIGNVDSAQNCVFTGVPITAATHAFPISQTAALYNTTANSITVTMPTIAALSSTDTNGRVQWFRLFKAAQPNSLIVNLGAGNTFSDGSTSVTCTAQGIYHFYCVFGTTTWYKG